MFFFLLMVHYHVVRFSHMHEFSAVLTDNEPGSFPTDMMLQAICSGLLCFHDSMYQWLCTMILHDWNVGMNPTSASDWSEVVLVLLLYFFWSFQSILCISADTTTVDMISRFDLN